MMRLMCEVINFAQQCIIRTTVTKLPEIDVHDQKHRLKPG